MDMRTVFEAIRIWANANEGFLTLALFVLTLLLGWVTGIFGALRNRPSLKIAVLPGPTFVCTFPTGRKHQGHGTHRTAFCVYLTVTNRGSAPTDLVGPRLGYHNYTPRFTWFWCWLEHQTVALSDFRVGIGDSLKVYPFLCQVNQLLPRAPTTYVRVGERAIGVVYFEQSEAWGGWLPRVVNDHTTVKIQIADSYGRRHSRVVRIPVVPLEEARRYNPSFGSTHEALQAGKTNSTGA